MKLRPQNLPSALACQLRKEYQIRALRDRCRERRAIVLSFDDGPSPSATPEVLDVLRTERARGTFFMIGERIGIQRELANRVVLEGHEIGGHSYSHLNAWKCRGEVAVHDFMDGQREVTSLLGSRALALYRPPYGKITARLWNKVVRTNTTLCWWTVDSHDTSSIAAHQSGMVYRILRNSGGVVLLHDFVPQTPNAAARLEYLIASIRLLCDLARREGFSLMTMGELLQKTQGRAE